eukprot:COSAG04_NODE_6179_length_1391_cov_8.689628_1_plen_84_part_00
MRPWKSIGATAAWSAASIAAPAMRSRRDGAIVVLRARGSSVGTTAPIDALSLAPPAKLVALDPLPLRGTSMEPRTANATLGLW